MKYALLSIFKTMRFLTMVSACVIVSAHADEYADASQLVRASKFTEALAKVEGFLATKPSDPQMRFLKGVIQRNLGKQADAIVTFTKLTEDFPELPEPHNNLAVLYAGQGQYDKARIALELAIRTNPSYATAHENIGDVYARLASQAYNKALQLDSANMAVAPKLALIREVFKPNLANARPATVASLEPVVASSSAPAPEAAIAPTAAVSKSASSPSPVVSFFDPKVSPATQATGTTENTKPLPVVTYGDPKKSAEAAVLAWAQAWSTQNMDAYLAAYGAEFKPSGKQSRSAWEQDRRHRITGKTHISVKVTELHAKVTGDNAVAKFRQAYKADSLSVSSRKTLVLQRVNNQWLITKESTGH